jgi:hypothetical protein
MRIYEDMSVNAVDGHCGKIVDVIVDPVRLRVTHLVINPAGIVSAPRVVPIAAVDHDADPLALLWPRRQGRRRRTGSLTLSDPQGPSGPGSRWLRRSPVGQAEHVTGGRNPARC